MQQEPFLFDEVKTGCHSSNITTRLSSEPDETEQSKVHSEIPPFFPGGVQSCPEIQCNSSLLHLLCTITAYPPTLFNRPFELSSIDYSGWQFYICCYQVSCGYSGEIGETFARRGDSSIYLEIVITRITQSRIQSSYFFGFCPILL